MDDKRFILDSTMLQPFDIIMEKGDNPRLSETYNHRNGTPYTHAKLYIGMGSYIDANGTGVKSQQVERTLYSSIDDAIVLRYNEELTEEQKIIIDSFVRSEIGKEFHTPRCINPYVKSSDEHELNREYCVRLVAMAYQKAGINIVKNALYCKPEEFINSTHLTQINIKLKEANDYNLEYANSECVINKQDEICGNMFELIRQITQADIQTEEQLVNFLIKEPSFDDKIYESIKNDSYFSMLEQYHKDHPEEYDVQVFINRYDSNALTQAFVLLKNAEMMQNGHWMKNLLNYMYLYETYRFKTFFLFVNLYISLHNDCEERAKIGIDVFTLLINQ